MKDEAFVSIVIAAYNVELYIANCIESVLRQTYSNFELIIVNDGSVDKTGVICDEYAGQDMRIKVIHQKNKGVGHARNKGLAYTSGKYITFIDSDDEVCEQYLENLLRPCQENGADISVCLFDYVSKNEIYRPVISGKYSVKKIDYQVLQAKIIGRCCGTLIKKKLLENICFDTDLFVGEDLLFFCKALNNAETISITEDKLYCYYIYEESSYNGTYNEKKFTEITSWKRVLELFEDRDTIFVNTVKRLFGWILLNNILRMEEYNYPNKSHREVCLKELRKKSKYVFNRYPGGGKRNIAMYPTYLVTCVSPKVGYFLFSSLMRIKHYKRK